MGNRSPKHTNESDSHDRNYVRPLQCKALGLSWCRWSNQGSRLNYRQATEASVSI